MLVFIRSQISCSLPCTEQSFSDYLLYYNNSPKKGRNKIEVNLHFKWFMNPYRPYESCAPSPQKREREREKFPSGHWWPHFPLYLCRYCLLARSTASLWTSLKEQPVVLPCRADPILPFVRRQLWPLKWHERNWSHPTWQSHHLTPSRWELSTGWGEKFLH